MTFLSLLKVNMNYHRYHLPAIYPHTHKLLFLCKSVFSLEQKSLSMQHYNIIICLAINNRKTVETVE